MITGRGKMYWRSGAWSVSHKVSSPIIQLLLISRYHGQILMNLMDGRGEFSWPNGDSYKGEYVNGMRNGVGDMQVILDDQYLNTFITK